MKTKLKAMNIVCPHIDFYQKKSLKSLHSSKKRLTFVPVILKKSFYLKRTNTY